MIPASHPLVGSSLRLQLGVAKLLGGGDGYETTLVLAVPLISRRIDLQCAPSPSSSRYSILMFVGTWPSQSFWRIRAPDSSNWGSISPLLLSLSRARRRRCSLVGKYHNQCWRTR